VEDREENEDLRACMVVNVHSDLATPLATRPDTFVLLLRILNPFRFTFLSREVSGLHTDFTVALDEEAGCARGVGGR
jgi:hypothetical protein